MGTNFYSSFHFVCTLCSSKGRHRTYGSISILTNFQNSLYSSLDFVLDNPGELVPEGTFCHFLDFLVQNEDNRGRHQHSGWTANPSRLIGAPISAIPTIFMPDALPGTTLPIYSGLGQAPNMLACLPGGL